MINKLLLLVLVFSISTPCACQIRTLPNRVLSYSDHQGRMIIFDDSSKALVPYIVNRNEYANIDASTPLGGFSKYWNARTKDEWISAQWDIKPKDNYGRDFTTNHDEKNNAMVVVTHLLYLPDDKAETAYLRYEISMGGEIAYMGFSPLVLVNDTWLLSGKGKRKSIARNLSYLRPEVLENLIHNSFDQDAFAKESFAPAFYQGKLSVEILSSTIASWVRKRKASLAYQTFCKTPKRYK